jgi:hypothetical protein
VRHQMRPVSSSMSRRESCGSGSAAIRYDRMKRSNHAGIVAPYIKGGCRKRPPKASGELGDRLVPPPRLTSLRSTGVGYRLRGLSQFDARSVWPSYGIPSRRRMCLPAGTYRLGFTPRRSLPGRAPTPVAIPVRSLVPYSCQQDRWLRPAPCKSGGANICIVALYSVVNVPARHRRALGRAVSVRDNHRPCWAEDVPAG